jgi:hypothetical protein
MSRTRLVARLSAFACGAVVALVVVASRQSLSAANAVTIHTCAAADGTLRLTGEAVPCGPEERRVRIKVRAPEDPECKEDNERLQKMERRLKDLEYRDRMGTLRGRRVRAPFEVVTKKGGRLLRIEEESVTFYNASEKPVVWIKTDYSGGVLHAHSATSPREVMIGARGSRSHLVIKEKGHDRIDLGRRANGRYSLQVYGPQNKQVAGFGQSEAGSGIMMIGDVTGTPKVSMFINKLTDGGTRLEVANSAGAIVGSMSAAGGGGQLQLTDAAGNSMVEAGLTEANVGVVRTLPGTCHFGIGILGVAPNCIVGKR